ncbi:CRISPR-associated autoregulator, DevR family [Thermosinus carboxydivorans Nor1]|uniref:CRISPR-associated autoregulator, DevR family n=1 Tax=Thermosinus carboxydivorans Nor1 TaxID=401526 RepID=A1HND6_9FIRM|nr:type I-B CRISPR-associated protein Cas7/Cst2/DevR [Thermosinus carboxydivorans]EAX48298.1 CRISPR-associated autoregulator, DevR family [Thermosinus carboxydivorans Nor1]
MAYLSGLLLIDCPASALNNAGKKDGMNTDNAIAVKAIKSKDGIYPYVSAQAFRYWWRESLKDIPGWTASPIYRESDIAYTDANPIIYAEDDLFGYMRAPSTKRDAQKQREESNLLANATAVESGVTLTRQSPLKVSTLVSVAPLKEITNDYGVMSRHEGYPVPFYHEFYRTTLQGLFSLDLAMIGRFYHIQRTGYKHLDEVRVSLAKERGLEAYDNGKAYQLPINERLHRVEMLLKGLSRITGGAKLALHYTDVTPRLCVMAVAKGGNHLFSTFIGANNKGQVIIKTEALKEIARVYKEELLSGIYVGLPQGYLDEQREELEQALQEIATNKAIYGDRVTFLGHPREAIEAFIAELKRESSVWLA